MGWMGRGGGGLWGFGRRGAEGGGVWGDGMGWDGCGGLGVLGEEFVGWVKGNLSTYVARYHVVLG